MPAGRFMLTVYRENRGLAARRRGFRFEALAEKEVEIDREAESIDVELRHEKLEPARLVVRLLDANRQPLNGKFGCVYVRRHRSSITEKWELWTTRAPELPMLPGKYEIRVSASGYLTRIFSEIRLEPGETRRMTTVLRGYVSKNVDASLLYRLFPKNRSVLLRSPVRLGKLLPFLDRLAPNLLVITPRLRESPVFETYRVRHHGLWTLSEVLKYTLNVAGLRSKYRSGRVWIFPPDR